MRIAIFTDQFYPELSGINDSISMLATEFGRRGHQVLFVAPRYSPEDFFRAKLPLGEKDYGPNVSVFRLLSFRYPGSPTGQSRFVVPYGASVSALKRFKPDIIHVQSPFGVGLEALFDAWLLKVPVVGTNHTPVAEFMPKGPMFPKWIVKAAVRYYSWYYTGLVFVSAPCNALLTDMSKHGFYAKNYRAVANPIDLAKFSPVKDEKEKVALKMRFGFSPHTVLYTGRLAEEKCVDVVLRAVALAKKEVPDICFVATGHGSAEASLKTLTVDLGLENNVKFMGFVDSEVFPLLYQASDIFTIMSTAETQSLSLMQAMASGLPSIVARAWGLPEYVDAKSGIVLEVGDSVGLAKNIVDLFNMPSQARTLGAGGIYAAKQYAPSLIAEKWEGIYGDAVKNFPPK